MSFPSPECPGSEDGLERLGQSREHPTEDPAGVARGWGGLVPTEGGVVLRQPPQSCQALGHCVGPVLRREPRDPASSAGKRSHTQDPPFSEMQSITVRILLPSLCLANYDSMSLTEHFLITHCLNERKKKKKQVRKRLLIMGWYLEVSIPEQASGQGLSL